MSAHAPGSVSLHSKDNPFPARLAENRLLSGPGSSKETRHFVVDLAGSGMTYKAGDSLGVFPSNRPSEVEELLTRLGATGEELVSPAALKLAAPAPLRSVLTDRLALAKPTRRFLEVLAAKATDSAEAARLTALLAPEGKEALVAYLEEREFVDLLAELTTTESTAGKLVIRE